MGFEAFHGNATTVRRLREMLARDRFPHAVILAGPPGSGKYTLALMLAQAMNCREHAVSDGLPDFCGKCQDCERIAGAAELEARVTEAVEAREGLKDTDKKETRILIQPHPDVMVVPPDPPQNRIKIGQVRRVTETIYFKPSEGHRKVYIFTAAAFMKEAANALLKVLEEPPESATLFLLAENPGELLPTIRSRCITLTLGALPAEEIAELLAARRKGLGPKQLQLISRLSGGAVGRALTLDLETYSAARKDALLILRSAVQSEDHSPLFQATESYRAGAEGQEKTDRLLRALYSLLEDILSLQSGAEDMVRNVDIVSELNAIAGTVPFEWTARAAQQLHQVESGMRRNLLRGLSLDSMAAALES